MTEWTARICAAFWIASLFWPRHALVSDRATSNSLATRKTWAYLWVLGAVSLAIHTAVAFAEKHNWSHDSAYAHTAQQTFEKIGIDWGGGLFFNYATLAWWLFDALAIVFGFAWSQDKRYRWATEWYLAFMFINATVVFGPSLWFAVALPVTLLLANRRRLVKTR